MQFYDYPNEFHYARKVGFVPRQMDWRQFYTEVRQLVGPKDGMLSYDPFTPMIMQTEQKWWQNRRPYYNVWPSIIPALTKVKLDLKSTHIKFPEPVLAIRFPINADHPLRFWHEGVEYPLRSMMVYDDYQHSHPWKTRDGLIHEEKALLLWMDVNDEYEMNNPYKGKMKWISKLARVILKGDDLTVEDSFRKLAESPSCWTGVVYPNDFVLDCARLACTLALMADDPEVVEPVVLEADVDKWEKTHDPTLVDKAIRRGNYGWNVGKSVEVVPHVRSASPAALYWTGKGRTVPKVRFRKGSIVHRRKLTVVPTGYMDQPKPFNKEGK